MYKERYSKTDPEFFQQDHDYYNRYKDLLLPHVIGPRVLDIGCGEGWLTKEIAELEHISQIVAVDAYDGPKQSHEKITYVTGRIPETLPSQPFDTIISTEFLEHITQDDFYRVCEKVRQMLPYEWSYFIGSTPNKMVETKNPFHLHEYTIKELNNCFAKAGFQERYLWHIRDLTVFKVK